MRILSDSEPGDSQPVSNNGYGFGGMPSPDIVQSRLDLMQKAFPNKVSPIFLNETKLFVNNSSSK